MHLEVHTSVLAFNVLHGVSYPVSRTTELLKVAQ